MRMAVLGRGLIFKQAPLVCTYNNHTIITLRKEIGIADFPSKLTQKVDSASKDN